MKYLPVILCFLLSVSCKNEISKEVEESHSKGIPGIPIKLKYAEGFNATDYGDYKTLNITKPWPNASKSYYYLIASKEQVSKMTFLEGTYDAIISDSLSKIVVTSTTHIPALELLEIENTLVGFPETDYISSKVIRNRIESGYVRDLGKNEEINTEVLLELNPNLVIGFGVDGVNKTFETIKNTRIPLIYNGDWVESSPLAKAEWIKLFGILFNKSKKADSIFNSIEANYIEAKAIAQQAQSKPTILCGAMHKDVWYLPKGESPEGQILNDINVHYLWQNTRGNGSLALNFEAIFQKGKDADIWLSPSYYNSLEKLKNANNLYTLFKAYQTQQIFSFTNTTGESGGVLYYELGTARPDLVLKDLIKICHPELLMDYKPIFFHKLK